MTLLALLWLAFIAAPTPTDRCLTASGRAIGVWRIQIELLATGRSARVSSSYAEDGPVQQSTLYQGTYTELPDTLTLSLTSRQEHYYDTQQSTGYTQEARPHRETLVLYRKADTWYLLEGNPDTNHDLPLSPC